MIGEHLFGCDICQEVCPWNHKFSAAATEPAFAPRPHLETPDVASFSTMDDAAFKGRYGDTPLARARRVGLQRNAVTVSRHVGTAER
jgi:epoxyqueuosine reductase